MDSQRGNVPLKSFARVTLAWCLQALFTPVSCAGGSDCGDFELVLDSRYAFLKARHSRPILPSFPSLAPACGALRVRTQCARRASSFMRTCARARAATAGREHQRLRLRGGFRAHRGPERHEERTKRLGFGFWVWCAPAPSRRRERTTAAASRCSCACTLGAWGAARAGA